MKNLSKILTALIIFSNLANPIIGFSAAPPACENFCNNTTDAITRMVSDPKCKTDPKCLSCVGNTLSSGQMANYCTAYTSTKKSNKKQTLQTATYGATFLTCGLACALSATAGAPLGRVCGGLGLAASGLELILALDTNDMGGSALGAGTKVLSQATQYANNFKMMTGKVAAVTSDSVKGLQKLSKSPACISAGLYGLLLGSKLVASGSMKKSNDAQCDVVSSLGKSVEGVTQSCLAGAITTPKDQSTSSSANMFAATAQTFTTPTLDEGIKSLGASTSDQFIKDMKDDLKLVEEKGKVNFADLVKRIEAGESLESFIAGNAPPEIVSAILNGDEKQKRGEKFAILDSLLGGGGYSATEAGSGLASGSGGGTNELGFGSAATPGSEVSTLDIDRKPASTAASALAGDGDVLHSSFAGSIFDIVSLRIKEQKGQYAEAEPEGRMNRVFNGYTDRDRKPSAKSGR